MIQEILFRTFIIIGILLGICSIIGDFIAKRQLRKEDFSENKFIEFQQISEKFRHFKIGDFCIVQTIQGAIIVKIIDFLENKYMVQTFVSNNLFYKIIKPIEYIENKYLKLATTEDLLELL